jgi:dUTP pyrophosphatase
MQKIRGFEKISFEQYCKDVNFSKQEYQDIKLPQRATKKSSGYDICAVYDFMLRPGEEIKLPTGLKAYMLDNEELLLFPRSSIGFKYNVRFNNTIPKIDSDYYNNKDNEGHIWLKFTNQGDKNWVVEKGEAIAQGSFYNYLIADNDNPISEERTGGLGSTNK